MPHTGADLFSGSSLLENLARQNFPAGTLYVIATPIGNACDITLRALKALQLADAVACEDTRNTAQLMSQYGLKKRLIAVHQHNERERAEQVINHLRNGERMALVSDAGTPAISDPGARLVDAVIAAGLRVMPLPGACAITTALSASGLIDTSFHFIGFLPSKATQRNTTLQQLRSETNTLVFYEAPHRVAETIQSMLQQFGSERKIVIARELTKLFEEIHRCTLGETEQWLTDNPNRNKGEFVLIVEGAVPDPETTHQDSERILQILLAECSVKQASSLASKITGQKKNQLYERALALKEEVKNQR